MLSGFVQAQPGWLGDTSQVSNFVFLGGLDNRQTFVRNQPVEILGYFAGIRLHGKHAFGLGYYHLPLTYRNNFLRRINAGSTSGELKSFDIWFLSIFYAYTVQNTRYFRIQIPMECGMGEIESVRPATFPETGNIRKTGLMTHAQLGADLSFKFCRWGGLNAALGYRKVFKSEVFKGELDGLYYAYGISVYFDALWKDSKRVWLKLTAPSAIGRWEEIPISPPEDL